MLSEGASARHLSRPLSISNSIAISIYLSVCLSVCLYRSAPVAVGPGVHHERDELGGGHGEVRPVDHKLGPVKRHKHIISVGSIPESGRIGPQEVQPVDHKLGRAAE